MSVLNDICAAKLDHVQRTRHLIPELVHQERARLQTPPRGFCDAIAAKKAKGEPALIAEVKKASPSKGIIRADFDPQRIAHEYQEAGATCVSVLTDQPYFKGTDEDFEAARQVTSLPMIRKDFMLTPYQVTESRALGADCILIIMAALSDDEIHALTNRAQELDLDILYEVHDRAELVRALTFSPRMIGVNARNLKTLQVDIQTSFDLVRDIPPSILKVAESGISSHDELETLHQAGFDAFLVGESLMREPDIGEAVHKLLGK